MQVPLCKMGLGSGSTFVDVQIHNKFQMDRIVYVRPKAGTFEWHVFVRILGNKVHLESGKTGQSPRIGEYEEKDDRMATRSMRHPGLPGNI